MSIQESHERALRKAFDSGPYYQLLQMKLEKLDLGFARLRMPVRQELMQIFNVVHGGAIGSLADTAVAFALLTLLEPEERVATVEMKMNFLVPAGGGQLISEARILSKGRRIALSDMEVKNKRGKLLAKGLATYMILGDALIGRKSF